MLRLRARPILSGSLARLNSTVAATEATSYSTESSPPPAASTPQLASASKASATSSGETKPKASAKTRGRRKRGAATRSLAVRGEKREWNQPVASGALPVYDEALKVIRADSRALKAELDAVRTRLNGVKDAESNEAKALEAKAKILEVQSEINLPDVRWKFRNGQGDLSKLVYRHLAEQKWRREGSLDMLMERIHQMNVVPDVLPSLHPSFELRVSFPQWNQTLKHPTHQAVDPGVFLTPKDTLQKPRMYATVFHPEPRLYTLLMVDPDVPDPETQSFSTFLHWMQPNITLSSSSSEISFGDAQHTAYIPPHPHKGTNYHRYVVLLLPHADPTAPLDVPQLSLEQREKFDVRAFCEHYGLDGAKGGGAHMWREVWSEDVSKLYEAKLAGDEPVFGHARKPDPYQEVKKKSRYMFA